MTRSGDSGVGEKGFSVTGCYGAIGFLLLSTRLELHGDSCGSVLLFNLSLGSFRRRSTPVCGRVLLGTFEARSLEQEPLAEELSSGCDWIDEGRRSGDFTFGYASGIGSGT